MSHSRRRFAQGLVAGLAGLVVAMGLVGAGRTVDVVETPRPSPGPTCTPTPAGSWLPAIRRSPVELRPTVGPPPTVRPTIYDGQ